MKGVKKCIFFALLGMGLLSFCQFSDTSALKHEYTALPYFSRNDVNGHSFYQPLFISGVNLNDINQPDYNDTPSPLAFSSVASDNKCTFYRAFTSKVVSGNSVQLSFNSFIDSFYNGNTNDPYSQCQRAPLAFGSTGIPNFNSDSIPPYIFGNPDWGSLLPYYYAYSHFYLADSYVDTRSGEHYSNSLYGKQLFGTEIHSFQTLHLPMEVLPDNIGQITQGRDIEIRGVFDFSGHSFEWGDLTNASFKLLYDGQTSDQYGTNSYTSGSIDCTANLRVIEFENFAQLEYSCPFQSPVTFEGNAIGFTLEVDSGGANYVWLTNGDLKWSGLYVITDRDETPGGHANSDPTGNDLASAPGSAEGLANAGNNGLYVDWGLSLENLFNFAFVNPFAPLFGMFSPGNCADIPYLAHWLNTSESTVCPVFPRDVRTILTPVFSLISVMIIFGFAVRWLGGRSGNFTEDSNG